MIERFRSTQKLPIVFGAPGCKPIGQAARDRQHDADADTDGDEVVPGKPRHLRQIAHRRFAAVGLPVRIGGEARRSAEGEIGGDRTEVRGI